MPLVVEACGGGWAPAAQQTWQDLSKLLALRTGESAAQEKDKLLQTLAVTLQRECARAVLRRLPAEGRPLAQLAEP